MKDNIKDCPGVDFASTTKAAKDRTTWERIVIKLFVVPLCACVYCTPLYPCTTLKHTLS